MVKGDLISLKTFLFLLCSLPLPFLSVVLSQKGSVPAPEDLDAKVIGHRGEEGRRNWNHSQHGWFLLTE